MTYAPDALRAARSLLLEHLDIHPTGSYPADLDPAEVGIVGDTAHAAKGTSYHLGKDQLTSTAYSRKTARDRAGLSNAASAVDVGEFRVTTAKGTFTQRDLAMWSVDQCQVNAADTRDIREIIYSPDGRRVLRYDRERGYASEPREGEADDSHLFHDHYSQYRDAEGRYTLRDHFARWLRTIGALEDDMEQTEKLAFPTGNANRNVGQVLADLSNLRDWLYTVPGGKSVNPPPPGSNAVLLVQAAQRPTAVVDIDEQELATALAPLLDTGASAEEIAAAVAATLAAKLGG